MKVGKALGWLVGIGILAAVIIPNLNSAGPRQTASIPTQFTTPQATQVSVEITSDPTNAQVEILGQVRGRTPLTLTLDAGRSYPYVLVAPEPYPDYRLYKPFVGNFTAHEDTAISVWIDRTTAEEQATQRSAAERARAQAAAEACRRRTSQAILIIESWTWRRTAGGSYVEAEGRVTNNTNSTLRNIQALVEYETSSNQFITSDYSTIELRDLLPGQSSPFSVLTNYNPAMAYARLRFREFFGPVIQTMDREDVEC